MIDVTLAVFLACSCGGGYLFLSLFVSFSITLVLGRFLLRMGCFVFGRNSFSRNLLVRCGFIRPRGHSFAHTAGTCRAPLVTNGHYHYQERRHKNKNQNHSTSIMSIQCPMPAHDTKTPKRTHWHHIPCSMLVSPQPLSQKWVSASGNNHTSTRLHQQL